MSVLNMLGPWKVALLGNVVSLEEVHPGVGFEAPPSAEESVSPGCTQIKMQNSQPFLQHMSV